jgi:hypothetical protein
VGGNQWRHRLVDFRDAGLALATVFAAYFGAAALDDVWAFWLLLLASLVYVFLRWSLPAVRRRRTDRKNLLRLGRQYPQALQAAGELKARVEDLGGDLAKAHADSAMQFASGIAEGRRRAMGELYAAMCVAKLTPLAMYLDGDALMFAVRVDPPEAMPFVGSLWSLRVKGIGQVKAKLRVAEISDSGDALLMTVADRRDAPFMKSLSLRANTESDPPGSLEIGRREYVSLSELEEEG